jgi:hypothetical protein
VWGVRRARCGEGWPAEAWFLYGAAMILIFSDVSFL